MANKGTLICLQSTPKNPQSETNNPCYCHKILMDLVTHESPQIIEISDLADLNPRLARIGDPPGFEDFAYKNKRKQTCLKRMLYIFDNIDGYHPSLTLK